MNPLKLKQNKKRKNLHKGIEMNPIRKTAIIVGILYIAATAGGVLSGIFSGTLIEKPLNLVHISANQYQVILVAFFELVMAVTVAGIAFMIYPILRQDADTETKKGLAVWYVGTRLIEGALFFVGVLCVLSLLKLSQKFVLTGADAETLWYQNTTTLLLAMSEYAWMLGQSIFCIGAAMFYYLLYVSGRIPHWLSVWGFIAAPLMFVASFLPVFGEDPNSTFSILLYLPMAVQEMVMAVWMIIKGFNPSRITLS